MSIGFFIIMNLINVVLGTARSVLTVRASARTACIINAISFTFSAGIIKSISGQNLWIVLATTFVTNLIGVNIALFLVRKFSKDKLWKIEVSCPIESELALLDEAKLGKLSYGHFIVNNYVIINFFCSTQLESEKVRYLVLKYKCKYFVSEGKNL